MAPAEIARRFWLRVEQCGADDCWPWLAYKLRSGYGLAYTGRPGSRLAHRFAWVLAHGRDVPEDLFVCHHCDTRDCCNPAHLFLGTASDNVRDMHQKGRAVLPSGPRKLTRTAAAAILRDPRGALVVARAYGVTPQSVDYIWKHGWGDLPPATDRNRASTTWGQAKLDAQKVRSIREDERLVREIARSYGLAIGTVYKIRKRQSWKHVA